MVLPAQVIDPHTHKFMQRMQDEPLFLALAQKVNGSFLLQTTSESDCVTTAHPCELDCLLASVSHGLARCGARFIRKEATRVKESR